ncbi:MAG: NYN domain-containing protein [Chloroflexi bacterium]|nr:NYN domain-containing protein [Chloroflexota bacterium]
MKVNIYVDGFNLYYGAVKDTPYRWLNIAEMCRLYLPRDHIHRIRYFTALVNPRPADPEQRVRQETYLRALETIPNLSIIHGYFLTHEITMPLAGPSGGYARVIKTEEKGSDANIATHLLVDGFRNDYELAVIVSNDSDLLLPIRVVAGQLGKPVGLLNPQRYPSTALLPHVRFVKQIRAGALAKCQFPVTLIDGRGTFTKPSSW